MKLFLLFVLTMTAYVCFDLVWLNVFAKNFINRQVGFLLAQKPDLLAALLFYLIFVGGLLYFCVFPAATMGRAALNGMLYGLATYATYELVNKSLLDRWTYALVWVDILWGMFACAIVSFLSFKLKIWLGV